MLSDEEKKAIKELTEIKELFEEDLKADYEVTAILDQIDLESLVIALNLIEKQSKEIEELEKNRKVSQNFAKIVATDYISNDKIKAKIEELEIEQESNREDLKIAIDNLLFQNIDKIGNKISINMSVREILHSLLEKE